MNKLTSGDLFWDMVRELKSLQNILELAYRNLEQTADDYDTGLGQVLYEFTKGVLDDRTAELKDFANGFELAALNPTVDFNKKLICLATMWHLADKQGMDAAVLWKLANE